MSKASVVFVVQHIHRLSHDADDVKFIGVYSTRRNAQAAVRRLRRMPGFSSTPKGFCISEYEIDQDNWAEGYLTWTPLNETPE